MRYFRVVALLAALTIAPLAFAETESEKPVASGPSKEMLLILAYSALWLGVGGYLWRIHARLDGLSREVQQLERLIGDGQTGPDSSST